MLESQLREKTGVNLTHLQLKNKFERLRKDWQLWKTLDDQTSKGWDPARQTWVGYDDEW